MTDSLLIAVHAFASRVLMSFSVDETLLSRQGSLFTIFRGLPFSVEMSPLIKARAFYFISVDMEAYATCSSFQAV